MASNGRLPANALVTVQAGIKLEPKTARAYRALVAAARRDGRTISIAPPAGGYRSFEVQADMRERPWMYGLNPRSGASLAAPGTSKHGLGICVDLVGTDLSYIIRTAARFGFTRPLPNDPNHFIFDGRTITAPVIPTSTKATRYTIQGGDTLTSIGTHFHVSVAALLRLNPTIKDPDTIRAGQRIRVN